MLSKLENKVKDKIFKLESQKKIVIKKLTNGLDLQMELEDLIELHNEIKQFKKNKRMYKILSLIFIPLMPFNTLFIVASIYSVIAVFIEKSNIEYNNEMIKNSNYKYCSKEDLEVKLSVAEKHNEIMKNTISEQRNQIKKYAKIMDEINYIKELEQDINDENFKKLKELYTEIPLLAFNSKRDYKNYLSYKDEKFKEEIIKSKILFKKK